MHEVGHFLMRSVKKMRSVIYFMVLVLNLCVIGVSYLCYEVSAKCMMSIFFFLSNKFICRVQRIYNKYNSVVGKCKCWLTFEKSKRRNKNKNKNNKKIEQDIRRDEAAKK